MKTAAELQKDLDDYERLVKELLPDCPGREAFRLGITLGRLAMQHVAMELAVKEVLPAGRAGKITKEFSLAILQAQARVLDERVDDQETCTVPGDAGDTRRST